jgi:ketosteroid isomerase-like protein
MENLKFIPYILLTAFCSCNSDKTQKTELQLKAEITQTETDFEKMVSKKGIAEGFYHFADPEAVIKREHDTLIIGKKNIQTYYSDPKYKTASVTWTPDYVQVSKNGDLGYTYGKYAWTSKDSLGKEHISKGIFHTVWKKQNDGSWKYVWD